MIPTLALLPLLPSPVAHAETPDVNVKIRTGLRSTADAAVVVGIESYPFLPAVPYAQRDADAFYNFLVYTRGVSPTRVSLLTNDPTAGDVREALKLRAAEVGPGGTLWVYFAGHGAADPETGERLLLGVDVQPKVTSLNDTQTYSLDELHALARTSPAAHVVAVVDACYTGTGRDGKVLLEGKRFAVPAYATQNVDPKVITWTAAGPAETSGPFEPGQHGLFTYFVVGALRGWADGEFDDRRDGVVTLAEARQFVYDAVRTVGGGEQNPAFEGTAPETERLVSGTGLEARPDLAALVSEVRGSVAGPAEKPKVATAPTDDFAARLAELKRLREEREAAEARERELATQLEGQRQARLDAAAGPLRQVAQRAWEQTVPLLDAGGPEASMAARLFVDTYGSLTVDVDGETIPVKVAEVDQARAWLARAEQGAVATAPATTSDATLELVDPLALYVPLSSHPLWEIPASSAKLAKRLGNKVGRDSWNDELWGDAADKAIEQGDAELAVYFLLHALEIDPQDNEWSGKLEQLGVGSAKPAAIAERLRLDASSDELWGDLGDALLEDDEGVAACVAFARARELDPSDTEWGPKFDENGCASMSGNRGGALADAKAALDADPQNDERVGDYADALLAAGRVDEACATYQRALDLDRTDSEWPGKLVGCLETGLVVTHSTSVAGPSGDALLQQVQSTRSDLRTAVDQVRAEPQNDERWGDLGDALGDDPLAGTVYAAAMRMDPSDAEWQQKLARAAGWDTLFGIFQEILAADPSNDERLGDYADRLMEAGRRDDACAAYRAALRFDPTDTEWPNKVATCDGAAVASTGGNGLPGDTGDATLDVAAAALRADPENDERWGDWGDALRDGGRSNEACQAYRKANTMDPGDQEWIDKLGACGGAVAAVAAPTEDLDDEALGDEGDRLMAYGDYGAACDAYQRALEADPQDSEWPGKALTCLLRLDPTGDEALGDLGDRLASFGRMVDACAAYKEALRIDKSDNEWKDRRADCRGVE
jgi:tetratricopeptide (TPR) repeat protein